jgi:hypothetical protein
VQGSNGSTDFYGVIKKIIFIDFPPDKEVVLLQCDWFDVPPTNRNQSKGYKKDIYGIIDLGTTILRFKADPYILGIQAEQVFYVGDVKNPNWASAIKMNPCNVFAPSVLNDANLDDAAEGHEHADADVQEVADAGITVPEFDVPDAITSWCRNDDEGTHINVSFIKSLRPAEFDEDQVEYDADTDDDEAYVNDGHVGPLG